MWGIKIGAGEGGSLLGGGGFFQVGGGMSEWLLILSRVVFYSLTTISVHKVQY